jgi:urea transport system permease protein
MSNMQVIVLQLLNTLVIIGVLVLASLGLAIIYGLMDVLNMAHGEFIMLGCYAVVATSAWGLNPWLGAVVAAGVVALIGVAIERGLLRRLTGRPIDALLLTWGLALVLRMLIQAIFGAAPQTVNAPVVGAVNVLGTPFPLYKLCVLGLTAAVTIAVLVLFRYPTFGMRVRATLQDREMAECLGVKVRNVYTLSFAIGSALAGFAGALLAPLISVNPSLGGSYQVNAFMTVIVGGLGSLAGAIGGSAVIGGAQGAISYFGSAVYAQVVVLAIAIVIVRVRPQGIFTRR